MVETNYMRLGEFEFVIDFGAFRRITECWSGPGWDITFSGKCVNGDFFGVDGRVGLYCEAAPLPFAKAADYTGVELYLPGYYDPESGEPFFALDVGESYEVSDVHLRFEERNGSRYRIEVSGTVSESVFGHSVHFTLSAWADEQPDHSHSRGSSAT